jgi:DNA-binding MarR family transcriptional regulator
MPARPLLSRIRVDTLDDVQPLGRHLVLVFREFELEVLDALQQAGYPDLTAADLDILRFIKPGGSRAADIAQLAGITKQGVAKALTDLEARGYIRRRADAGDSRAKVIEFTRAGEALITKAIESIRRVEHRYERLIGRRRMQDMKRLLRQLFDDHQERKVTS